MSQTITFFTKKSAELIVGGAIRDNKKMPCKTWNLSAWDCKTGSKLAKVAGSICSECYAKAGFYNTYRESHAEGYKKRLDSIDNPNWVNAMIKLIGNDPYFRWMASGDIQSLDHLKKIVQIAELMPQTKFWLPTHEVNIVKDYVKSGLVPVNLIIRISAVYIDKPCSLPKSLEGHANILISNVHKVEKPMGFNCNAPSQGGACLDCRACWDTSVKAISYHAH